MRRSLFLVQTHRHTYWWSARPVIQKTELERSSRYRPSSSPTIPPLRLAAAVCPSDQTHMDAPQEYAVGVPSTPAGPRNLSTPPPACAGASEGTSGAWGPAWRTEPCVGALATRRDLSNRERCYLARRQGSPPPQPPPSLPNSNIHSETASLSTLAQPCPLRPP